MLEEEHGGNPEEGALEVLRRMLSSKRKKIVDGLSYESCG
jgi:hypothetical protein